MPMPVSRMIKTETNAVVFLVDLPDFQSYAPPRRSELDGIGQNIDENLIQTQSIAEQFLFINPGKGHIKILPPLLRLRLYKIDDTLQGHLKIERLMGNGKFAVFDF